MILLAEFFRRQGVVCNGERVLVLRADLFLSAIPVPSGEVRVTLEYAPIGILASSLLTAPFAVALGYRTFRPRPQTPGV